MGEANDKTPPRVSKDQPVTEEQRREQGFAVAGINALSASVSIGTRSELGFVEREDAMEALAREIDAGRLGIPRLRVLDSLVRLASRRPELRRDDPAHVLLVEALVRHAKVPPEQHASAVAAVRQALDTVAQLSTVSPGHNPWQTFTHQTAGALRLSAAEVEKPQCNDRQIVIKGTHRAIGVTVEFLTNAAPGAMTVCDPRRWYECTPSFKPMTPWPDPQTAVDEMRPDGWRKDLLETLDFYEGETLETPLRFTYSIDQKKKADPDWVHLDYVLIEETEDIAVDEGSIDLRRVVSGPNAGRTRVIAKKAILFRNPLLAEWPTVACDTFWTDLVVNAAVGCLGDPGESTKSIYGGEGAMADPKAEALNEAIKDATEAAQKSIEAYAELAKQAATQLTGAKAVDNATWAQLTTKAFSQAAGDVARTWTLYNEVLTILGDGADQGGPKPDPKPDV